MNSTTDIDGDNNTLKPEPVSIAFAIGNTYKRLSPSEAQYDKRTGRHLKIHDWTLYVDVLPGYDVDIIDRVTFDMRDDSFLTTAFTCHSPIRIQNNLGSQFIGRISGISNQNNSQQEQIGQSTKEGEKVEPPITTRPNSNNNECRWRFSTRQQTFGPVDVHINIRGVGGCRCTVPYKIKLEESGYECPQNTLPMFIEKRPHQQLKPLKMVDSIFCIEMQFEIRGGIVQNPSYDTAKSVYSRSKLPICYISDDGQIQDFANKQSASMQPWLVQYTSTKFDIITMSSPPLTGGQGLNDCYKIIEGLPPSCVVSDNYSATSSLLNVQIDVTNLSLQQITKICQNFVKYEEAMDSFMSYNQREDRCKQCRSNKAAVEGSTNKQRNVRIAACGEKTLDDLLACMNPSNDDGQYYKLDLRSIHTNNKLEFRQHVSSKDKTTVTHWIRFCTALVRNSARLRSPAALKLTTSIEEEFDLLFEYAVKDRCLRNFYRDRRDSYIKEEEEERTRKLLAEQSTKKNASYKASDDDSSMSISGSSSDGEIK